MSKSKSSAYALIEDDASAWQVGITRETIQRILQHPDKKADPGDMVALWMFYAYTARWQNVSQPRATTGFTAKGLRWTAARVIKAKAGLKSLGLVQDSVRKDASGRIVGWYVRVLHLAKVVSVHPHDFPGGGESLDKCSRSLIKGNALGVNKSKEPKETTLRDVLVVSKMEPEPRVKTTPRWKPNTDSKQDQLDYLPVPNDYPSQVEVEEFIEENAEQVANYRPDIYSDLCNTKWRQWKERANCWKPIRDWRKYITALNDSIEFSAKGN